MSHRNKPILVSLVMLTFILSCSIPSTAGKQEAATEPPASKALQVPTVAEPPTLEPTPPPAEPAAPPPEPSPLPIQHVSWPSGSNLDPSTIHDQVTEGYAPEKRAYAGDDFFNGRLERPFTRDMEYLGHLDIVDALLAREKDFLYFTLVLVKPPQETGGQSAWYGVEMDLDIDGRGDYLLAATAPSGTEWAQEGVKVWQDGDKSVGGETPIWANPPFGSGNGYETLVFDTGQGSDPDLAWSRLDPGGELRINLALKLTLYPEGQIFTWGAFADGAVRDPAAFDLNDRFSNEEAGSAMKESEFYPLNNFFAFDNTCRAASNFTALGGEPGICQVYTPPIPEEGGPSGPNCHLVCTGGLAARICHPVCN